MGQKRDTSCSFKTKDEKFYCVFKALKKGVVKMMRKELTSRETEGVTKINEWKSCES